jgi:hypothetical protein
LIAWQLIMDCRVKPGNDNGEGGTRITADNGKPVVTRCYTMTVVCMESFIDARQ